VGGGLQARPRESPPLRVLDHDEGEQDGILRAHYVYVPPASPLALPGDLLALRHSARASSPVAAVTGIPGRAWFFTHTFTFRGLRGRVAMDAPGAGPAWWPRRAGTRRKGIQVWGAVGRDLVRVSTPPLITWVALALLKN